MTAESFNALKEKLEKEGKLPKEDIDAVTKEKGELTEQEHINLEALRLKLDKENRVTPSMDDYLKATKILDTAAEGSEEYKSAQAIVDAFEKGA